MISKRLLTSSKKDPRPPKWWFVGLLGKLSKVQFAQKDDATNCESGLRSTQERSRFKASAMINDDGNMPRSQMKQQHERNTKGHKVKTMNKGRGECNITYHKGITRVSTEIIDVWSRM